MASAPTEFTVAQVMGVSAEPWGDDKNMRTWVVRFDGDDTEWKVFREEGFGPEPAHGVVLKGWKNADKGTFGLAKDKPYKPGGRRRGGDEGPGLQWQDKPYQSSATHPRDEVRMIRTSALSSAPAFVEQMLTLSLEDVPPPKTPEQYWHLVDRVVARIEASYGSALGAYDERVSPQQQLPEVPADTDGLTEEQRAHDASIPF